jgi:DNA-binding GntR family transcriptional regulator
LYGREGSDPIVTENGKTRVRAVTLRRQVADALREAILSGELQPGEKLREIDLAERFGVSRNPVREAIGELEQQGLIISEPNRAKTVVSPSDEDLRQAFQVRASLELLALHLAWDQLTDDVLAEMRRLVGMMEAVAGDLDLSPVARHGRLNVLDARLHGLLVETTGNQILMRAWDMASPLALGFIRDLERERDQTDHPDSTRPEPHAAFLAAIEARDLAAAASALMSHLSRSWLPPAGQNGDAREIIQRVSALTQDISRLE